MLYSRVMDSNRIYNILEGDAAADQKRSALLEYLQYCLRKLPPDVTGRKSVAQNFAELLKTDYFAEENDDKAEYVLIKARELQSKASQSDSDWHDLEELVERL